MEALVQEINEVKLKLAELRGQLTDKEHIRECYVAQAYLGAAITNIEEVIQDQIPVVEETVEE